MLNITSRLKNIELKVSSEHGEQEIIVLTEDNGNYYMEKDGQKIKVAKPENNPNKLTIILNRYSDPKL